MSKLNPQKASAYVGPGVLRKGGKITPVPNGPLIKKKGPFKGSTLKSGGKINNSLKNNNMAIKKAQVGVVVSKKDEKANPKDFSYLRKSEKSVAKPVAKPVVKTTVKVTAKPKAKCGTKMKKK